jgi:hypothetical protein
LRYRKWGQEKDPLIPNSKAWDASAQAADFPEANLN